MKTKIFYFMIPAALFYINFFIPTSVEAERKVSEAELKSAFLFNFFKVVEWPRDQKSKSVTLCILGDDEVKQNLGPMSGKKKYKDYTFKLKEINSSANLSQCQILYITNADSSEISSLLMAAKKYSILTVGDSPDFNKMGGIIRFYNDNDHIRFEINKEKADEMNLKISSQLLSLARLTGES